MLARLSTACGPAARPCGAAFVPRASFSGSAPSEAPARAGAKPKAPNTSYQLFQKDQSVRERLGIAGMPVAESSKKLAAAWKQIGEADKAKYTQEAAALKAEHEAVHGKPVRATRKKVGGGPKSPFAAFVAENFAGMKQGNEAAPAVMKRLGQKWKQLSAVEKTRFQPASAH